MIRRMASGDRRRTVVRALLEPEPVPSQNSNRTDGWPGMNVSISGCRAEATSPMPESSYLGAGWETRPLPPRQVSHQALEHAVERLLAVVVTRAARDHHG